MFRRRRTPPRRKAKGVRHPPEMRWITRFEYGRAVGWWVRFQRNGDVYSRFFSDSKHGGKDLTLKVAQAFRDRAEPEVPKTQKPPRPVGEGRVYREVRSYQERSTGELVYYSAISVWIRLADGRPAHTSYSISKHGEQKAKRLATAWLKGKKSEPL